MVVLYKTDDPARLNSTDIYVSNDEIRVDGMEYGTSIREEYSEDDELVYTIPREEFEKDVIGSPLHPNCRCDMISCLE